MRRLPMLLAQVFFLVLVLAGWQWGSTSGVLDPFFFGSPAAVVDVVRMWVADGTLGRDAQVTLTTLMLGWVLGMLLGTGIGSMLYASRFMCRVMSPFLALLNATPRMVFYPFFGIVFGFSLASKVGLVVFVIIVFAIINVLSALREVDADLVSHVRVIGGSRRTVVRTVYAPSLVAASVASSRVTFAFALQATIISEFFGPSEGLGFRVEAAQGAFDINQVWAALGVTVLVAVVVDGALQMLRGRLEAWRGAGA